MYKLTLIDEETNEEYEVKMDMDDLTINQFGLQLVKSNGKQVYFTNKLWKKVEVEISTQNYYPDPKKNNEFIENLFPVEKKLKINGNEEYYVSIIEINQNGVLHCATKSYELYYNPLFVSYFKVD